MSAQHPSPATAELAAYIARHEASWRNPGPGKTALEKAALALLRRINAARLTLEPTPLEMATALIDADSWLAASYPEYRPPEHVAMMAGRASYTLGLWVPPELSDKKGGA